MTEQTSFRSLLKYYRQAAGLSQETLAARAGLSARAISDLERGINRTPRYETLELLSSALSLSSQQYALLQAAARPDVAAARPDVAAARPDVAAAIAAPRGTSSPGLPLPPTRLVGREQERFHAFALLRRGDTHLLTLLGPGGVGKTRLALQLAWDLAADFADGVVYVPLAPIRDAALVPGVVTQFLGIREQVSSSNAEQVRVFLHNKQLLLLLDNVEQVLDCASFVADLLASCPCLSVLVTSKTPLRLRAEQEMLLAPLPLQDAVTLFRERAQALRPDRAYAVDEVAAICEQVDRLPLAIELAAMHVKILSLAQVGERLSHRLRLLRGGARDLPARQQTMEDAIAWSYELLTEQQQRCFRTLGVFVAGWTLEAAEAMCGTGGEAAVEEIVLMLAALVDASLVQTEMLAPGVTRFSMLELIRDYALERLQAADEEEPCCHRHAAYYARLAERIAAHFGPEQGAREAHFVGVMAQELPNARAALQWAEEKREAALGLRLTGFTRLWHIRGEMSEAERWLERMLALDREARERGEPTAPLTLRIERLYGLGRTLVRHGRAKHEAQAAATEALQLAQRIGDHNSISNAFATLGMIAQANGMLDEAEAAFSESYTHASLIVQRGLMSRALFHLAELARMRGERARATALSEEALAHAQATGMRWDIPIMLTLLAHLARELQQSEAAIARYREALTLYRTFSSPNYTAGCLEGFAAAICAEGHYVQATRCCAAAASLREQVQVPLLPTEREAFDQAIARAKAALDGNTFAREWTTGAALTHDEAIDDALSSL